MSESVFDHLPNLFADFVTVCHRLDVRDETAQVLHGRDARSRSCCGCRWSMCQSYLARRSTATSAMLTGQHSRNVARYTFDHRYKNSVVTRVGATRGGNWRCHPYFFLKNWPTFFSPHPLSAASSAVSPLFIFSWETDDLFGHHSGVTPWWVSPRIFFTCQTSFVHYSL